MFYTAFNYIFSHSTPFPGLATNTACKLILTSVQQSQCNPRNPEFHRGRSLLPITIIKGFVMTRPGIEPWSPAHEVDVFISIDNRSLVIGRGHSLTQRGYCKMHLYCIFFLFRTNTTVFIQRIAGKRELSI